MTQALKIIAFIAILAPAPARGDAAVGPVNAAYAVRFNPAPAYTAVAGGSHGGQIGGELFFAPKWSVSAGLSYAWRSVASFNRLTSVLVGDKQALDSAEAANKVKFDSSRDRAVTALVSRYHGPDNRLYASGGLGVSTSDVSAHQGDAHRYVRRVALLPELGYGYQWVYRHGGFVAVGGSTIYRIPLAAATTTTGADSSVLSDATGAGARLYPALRLGIGAFLR